MMFDAQTQSPQPAQQQPSVERTERGARNQGEPPDEFNEFIRSDKRSRRHVVMAADILGRAVNDGVNAEVERALVDRRRERVVADSGDAATSGKFGDEA